jgi:hypothetical protein
MMQEHIIRALLASSTSAIGAFVRLWLLLMACAIGGMTCLYMFGMGLNLGVSIIFASILTVTCGALPAAIVAAILIAAVKF